MSILLMFLSVAVCQTRARSEDQWSDSTLPPSWSWPDLQRTSYTVIIEKCAQPCTQKPLVGRGYMYIDYTVDKTSPKIYPRWFFSDVYDRGTLDSFTQTQFDAVIGADGNYTYMRVVQGVTHCNPTPYPWDRFPQTLTLKKGPQPISTGFPLPPKQVVAYEVVHGSYGNRLEVYLDPSQDNQLWGLRWFSELTGVAGNQSMIFHEESIPESIDPSIFDAAASMPNSCGSSVVPTVAPAGAQVVSV